MAGIFGSIANAVGPLAEEAVRDTIKTTLDNITNQAHWTPIISRELPDRANLSFYFPNPNEGADYHKVGLPFFENPKITESKKARYKKHSLLARSSNLYTYLGADSRRINVSFNITLPHLIDLNPINPADFFSGPDAPPEDERMKFSSPAFSFTDDGESGTAAIDYMGKYYIGTEAFQSTTKMNMKNMSLTVQERLQYARQAWIDDLMEHGAGSDGGVGAYQEYRENALNDQTLTKEVPVSETTTEKISQSARQRAQLIDIVVYWVNIIRSSVTNHSTNPLYGPPIIRLRHGLLYQDVPCICTDYRLDWDEAAGYDVETLLPRRLKIVLNLDEIRTGDFQSFDSMDIIKRDNLAGWESVISGGHNMDPGYDIYMKDFNSWASMKKHESTLSLSPNMGLNT